MISQFVRAVLVAVVLCAAVVVPATAFEFSATVGGKKCFSEELTTARYRFTYHMRRSLASLTAVTVTGEDGHRLWEMRPADEEGAALLIPPQAAVYTVCFAVSSRAKHLTAPPLIEMNLELEEVALQRDSKKYRAQNEVAEDPAIAQAEYLDRTVKSVKESFNYFVQREAPLRDTNESNNGRLLWMTVLTIVVVACTTALRHFRTQAVLRKMKVLQ